MRTDKISGDNMIDANELRAAIRRIQWKPVHGSDDEAAVDVSELMNEIDRLERANAKGGE